MISLANILHNIADHTQTLWYLLNDQSIAPDIAGRLKQHILLEEKENSSRLQAMIDSDRSPLTQKLLDHSYFIQRIIEDDTMPFELRKELLDHFNEEHQEWKIELVSNSDNRKWTVGPLWPQGA